MENFFHLTKKEVVTVKKERAVMEIKIGDTVKVVRYDSYPHNATMKISFELAEVMADACLGAIMVRWKTGPSAGSLTTVMANTLEAMPGVIDQLAAITEAGKIRITPWSARDDVTTSD